MFNVRLAVLCRGVLSSSSGSTYGPAKSVPHYCSCSDDPDVFGTLSARESNRTAKLNGSGVDKDGHDDIKKFLHVKGTNDKLEPKSNSDTHLTKKVIQRWQTFSEAQNKKIFSTYKDWVKEDDDEFDEEIIGNSSVANPKCNNALVTSNKSSTVLGKIKLAKKAHSDIASITNKRTDNRDLTETFGTLSTPDNAYEDAVIDEGDLEEERYQNAKINRCHHISYYEKKLEELCCRGNSHKLGEALKMLEVDMPADGMKPSSHCYHVVLNACGRAGYSKKAFQLYNQLKKRGYKPNDAAFTGLFTACANSPWPETDGLQRAKHLREQLIAKGYLLNPIVYNAMIKAFGRGGDIDTAFTLVDEIIEKGLLVKTDTINFLLQACISNKEIGFRHALMVWKKMRKLRLAPDIYSYNLLVRAVQDCNAGDPQLLPQLLNIKPAFNLVKKKKKVDKMVLESITVCTQDQEGSGLAECNGCTLDDEQQIKKQDDDQRTQRQKENQDSSTVHNSFSQLEPSLQLPNLLSRTPTAGNAISIVSLDTAVNRLALLGGPVGILHEMEMDRVRPNLKTFTQLLDAIPSQEEAEMSLLKSMDACQVTPDATFFNMLIRRRHFRKDNSGAREVLPLMQVYQVIPDIMTFGCLAIGCQSLNHAERFLKDMHQAGLRPNVQIMSALVGNGLRKENYQFTLEMLMQMRRHEVHPDELVVKRLEAGRTRARDILIKLEKEKNPSPLQRTEMDSIRVFLFEYKQYLKKSDAPILDHPWAQYRDHFVSKYNKDL